MELRPRHLLGPLLVDEVRAAHGPVEQGASREDGARLPTIGVLDQVGQVRDGVPGSGHGRDKHRPVPHLIPVGHRLPIERHRIGTVDHVIGRRSTRELEAAGHVVVVDVRLENRDAAETLVREHGLHAIDVALRVDHDRHAAVVDDVAAVSEVAGLENFHVQHPGSLPCPAGCTYI